MKGLNKVLLAKARELLPKWMPGGVFFEDQYIAKDEQRKSEPGKQNLLVVDLKTGAWQGYSVSKDHELYQRIFGCRKMADMGKRCARCENGLSHE
jgi:hypothetical protein